MIIIILISYDQVHLLLFDYLIKIESISFQEEANII
ncbi:MAG: hypothetical protein MPEBLZ_01475 [Candidatus Methanoperedens nitroreducens]|uniref:Uncharacterized protein n=1 Tax=Candidatus Methanoperedens nitratireducens TaxID=1392998 RepID=A0A0P8CAW4_9EURY|nr:MAG: hypothetical protein MPEBLZ_01475 [Candidatus Methanoperedens sp. BLZ1]